MGKAAVMLLVLAGMAACSGSTPAGVTQKTASVDPSYTCPAGATDAPYILHGVLALSNGSSSTVTIKSVTAVMTVAAIKGPWLERVGDKYEAPGVTASPTTVAAGGSALIQVTIPSSCTRGKTTGSESSYGDYSVGFTVTTSSGAFRIDSGNRHRIVAA